MEHKDVDGRQPGLPGLFDRPPVRTPAPLCAAPADVEMPIRTCPNCGTALEERKCRLFCPRASCGYYLSCSDYY